MKKHFLYFIVALTLTAACAFGQLTVTDLSVGGTWGVGAAAINKALVFSKSFDIAKDDGMDGTNLVHLLSVPEGVLPVYAVLNPADFTGSASVTLYKKSGTNAWSSLGTNHVVSAGSEAPYLYNLLHASSSTLETSLSGLPVTKWGFKGAANSTNALATAGTITVSIFGIAAE